MRRLAIARPTWHAPQPLRAAPMRAVLEAGAGFTVFAILGLGLSTAPPAALIGVICQHLGQMWLLLWPAWRLRRIQAHGWIGRWLRGIGRAVLFGLALGILGAIISRVVALGLHTSSSFSPLAGGSYIIGFCLARPAVLLELAIARRVRRRLRWQLMVSHLTIILLTFILLAAAGSVLAVNLLLPNSWPRPENVATSLAAILRPQTATQGLDRQWAQRLLDDIEANHIQVRGGGQYDLVSLVLGNRLDSALAVVSLNGTILAGAHQPSEAAGQTVAANPLPGAALQTLRRAALAGKTATVTLPWPEARSIGDNVGMAPLLDQKGHTIALVLVQSPVLGLTAAEFPALTVAVFGVATLTLTFATLILTLGLSALFGYLLAHGLTRRLEAVSRAAAAIAAGDLSRRTPVTARNEVGRLAGDFNRMAAHLETTMGELQKARRQAEEALRARQELVAAISHELRTPLAIVRAYLDSLSIQPAATAVSTAPGGRATQEHGDIALPATTLTALQAELDRLASLVDDLFSLSRVEAGVVHVQCSPTDVGAIVEQVAALMRPLAQNEGKLSLAVHVAPALPLAMADGDRLHQILGNLVRNAVRHTPEGGIIALSVDTDGPWIVIAVADTGEGIPPADLPRIFERFYRVDQARTRTSGGAGLGLAIVREFVELMGGHVTVESSPGEGSCFKVFLPAA